VSRLHACRQSIAAFRAPQPAAISTRSLPGFVIRNLVIPLSFAPLEFVILTPPCAFERYTPSTCLTSMFTQKSFVCLDLGAGSVKAAEFQVLKGGELVLNHYGIKALGSEGFQESKREKALLAATKDLFAARGISSKTCNIVAPGHQVFTKFVKLPAVDNHKVKQIIHYEAQQNIPYPIEQAVWDFQILGALPSGELEVLLVAVKADSVESLFRTADAANLKIQLVDAAPSALCNAFRYNYGDLDGCTLLIDIGARTTNVLLFENGKFFGRSLNIGANTITQEFAAESKLPFAKAEEIKINEGFVGLGGAYEEPESAHQAAVSKIARQVLTRLHIQVNQTIQFFRGQQGGSAPTRLLLAGGGSTMPYTTEFFAEKLNISVEYFNPFRKVTVDAALDLPELAKAAHSCGELVGLALRNVAQCPVELNLIPKSIRARETFNARKPFFFATVASIALTIFAYGYFFSKVTEIKRESLAQLRENLIPLQARADEFDAQLKQIKYAQNELDVYSGYLRDRFFWPEALVEMRNLLMRTEENLQSATGRPVGVWIESFGAVDPGDLEPEETTTTTDQGLIHGVPAWLVKNPRYFERLYPDLYKIFVKNGWLEPETPLVFAKPQSNTNLVTIAVKFRAVNLNNPKDPAANGRLAFAVAEEFKKSGLFDANGTKLTGQMEEPEMITRTFGTFRFNMTLKLKNEMQL
jgi:type IV pilus assembly protein PilM